MESFIFYICSMNRNAMRWWSSWRWSKRRLDRTCSVTYKKWVTFKNNFRYYLLLLLSIYFTFIRFDSFTFELQEFYKNKIFFLQCTFAKLLPSLHRDTTIFMSNGTLSEFAKRLPEIAIALYRNYMLLRTLQKLCNFTRILQEFCTRLNPR